MSDGGKIIPAIAGEFMMDKRPINYRWVKSFFFLLLAIIWFTQAKSTASNLLACGFLCFAWCEAFRKYQPPIKLTLTVRQIYGGLKKNSEYRPEPKVLVIGMLGVAFCVSGLIFGIASLV